LTVSFLGGDRIRIGGGDAGPLGIRLCLNLDTYNGSNMTDCIFMILDLAWPSSSYYFGVYFIY